MYLPMNRGRIDCAWKVEYSERHTQKEDANSSGKKLYNAGHLTINLI